MHTVVREVMEPQKLLLSERMIKHLANAPLVTLEDELVAMIVYHAVDRGYMSAMREEIQSRKNSNGKAHQ